MKKGITHASILLILFTCSSCFTYKRITKSGEPITKTDIAKLKVGAKYKIQNLDNYKFIFKVNSIDSVSIRGDRYTTLLDPDGSVTHYQSSIDEFIASTSKISKRKFSPLLTICIPLTAFVILVAISTSSVSLGSFQ